jgi:putative aminopeptidase FrvX
MTHPRIDTNYLINFLVKLLNTPSPTGFAEQAIAVVENELSGYKQLKLTRTRKGALVAKWPGASKAGDTADVPHALTAHVDTLGAMVREIKSNGRLEITRIGGLLLNAVETEGCWVFTSNGEKVRGSLLVDTASGHVYGPRAAETKRDEDHM